MENDSQRRKRLEAALPALAAELGNVTEACRRLGVDRSLYYRMLRRMRKAGDRAQTAPGKAGPAKAAREDADGRGERLLQLCLEYPEWGCDRLALYLTLTGNPVSSPTVQKFLIRNGLGRMAQRLKRRNPGASGGAG